MDTHENERYLERAVLDYLARNPQAMDTTEGIALWWIPMPGGRVDVEALEAVLDGLTARGLLERVGTGTHTHYRRSRPAAEKTKTST